MVTERIDVIFRTQRHLPDRARAIHKLKIWQLGGPGPHQTRELLKRVWMPKFLKVWQYTDALTPNTAQNFACGNYKI